MPKEKSHSDKEVSQACRPKLGVVKCTCHHSTHEAEAEGHEFEASSEPILRTVNQALERWLSALECVLLLQKTHTHTHTYIIKMSLNK